MWVWFKIYLFGIAENAADFQIQHLTFNKKNCKRAYNLVLGDKLGVSPTVVRPVETVSGYMFFGLFI